MRAATHPAAPHEHKKADAEDDQQPVLCEPFHNVLL
jgi:hypothetical protein